MPTQTYWITHPETGRKVRVPSVTTVNKFIGDKGGLMNWYFKGGKEAAEREAEGEGPFRSIWDLPKGAAEVGTIVHLMIECDLLGHEFQRSMYSDDSLAQADAAYRGWVDFREDRKLDVAATELSLTSAKYRYGGTMDLVARIDGKLTLVDFKTSKAVYAEYLIQLAAYAALWAEHNDDRLERMALLRLSKTDGSLHWHSWPADSPTIKTAWRGFEHALGVYDVLARKLKDAA